MSSSATYINQFSKLRVSNSGGFKAPHKAILLITITEMVRDGYYKTPEIGENLGSGFPLILSAWDEKHWIRPELVEQPELHQIKLTLHIPTSDVVKNVVKDVVRDLSDRQRLILDFLRRDNTPSAHEMSEMLPNRCKPYPNLETW